MGGGISRIINISSNTRGNKNDRDESSISNYVHIVYRSELTACSTPLVTCRQSEQVILARGMLDEDWDGEAIFHHFCPWMKFDFKISFYTLELVSHNWRCIMTGCDRFIFQEKYSSPSFFFGTVFYSKVVEKMPEAMCLFSKKNSDAVANELVHMISVTIRKLWEPQNLLQMLFALGDRHVTYGVKSASSVGCYCECMIDALKFCSGSSWNLEFEDAWLQVVSLFAFTMGSRMISPA